VAEKLAGQLGTTVDKLYDAAKKGEPLAPKPLDASAQLDVSLTASTEHSQNVVGILEGADPKLRDEYLVISAHYDHLKTNEKGEIYPGADDDGSGTAAVLTLARAFSLERPARSILVVFHAGEELGLLGSEYNADVAPAVPLQQIVADLNIDMIGRSKASGDGDARDAELTDGNSIYLIGADKISSELNRLSEQTNADTVRMRLDYAYNDPNHPQQFYYRSDHWNYAKHGIPVIFYFSGVHADYHQTSDTVDKIDFDKMAKVARLVFATGWRIANLDHRLTRDR
jgi:Zn-dependent M28 family amino/carboxypeptidase